MSSRAVALRAVGPAAGSLALHLLVAALIASAALRKPAAPRAEAVQIEVVDAPRARAAEPAAPSPSPPRLPRPAPRKLARTPAVARPSQPLPVDRAPPPPTREAEKEAPPVVLPGVTFESTTRSGPAVAAGNTLYGDPGTQGRDPAQVRPYKADRYASAAQVSDLPRTLSCDGRLLERYYPEEARRRGFEGDVVLRLLIDADGSVARAELTRDPGQGLGAAGLRAIRECRFAGARLDGQPVATTVSFTLHFTLR